MVDDKLSQRGGAMGGATEVVSSEEEDTKKRKKKKGKSKSNTKASKVWIYIVASTVVDIDVFVGCVGEYSTIEQCV